VHDSITVETGPIESSIQEPDTSTESVGGTTDDISVSEATDDDDVMDDSDIDLNEEMDLDD
jgi:hypothetical protein